MLVPKTYEELAETMVKGKVMLFFTSDWCGDCVFIKPHMPDLEKEFPEYTFIQVDRDGFIEVCQQWNIMGIPSFIALDEGQETGRFVSKDRKTKEEISEFIKNI